MAETDKKWIKQLQQVKSQNMKAYEMCTLFISIPTK